MEQVKQPGNLIGIANTAGLIGITAYFYKQNEALRHDVNVLAQQLASVANRVQQLIKDDTSRQEIITKMRSELQTVSSTLDDLSVRHEDYDEDLEEIVAVLGKNSMEVNLPSQSEPSPPPRRRTNSSRSKRKEPLVRDRKPASRSRSSRKPSREVSKASSDDDDDDDDVDDLIDTVRNARKRS